VSKNQRQKLTVDDVIQGVKEELTLPEPAPSPLETAIAELKTFQQRFRASPVTGRFGFFKEVIFSLVRSPFSQQFEFNRQVIDILEVMIRDIEQLKLNAGRNDRQTDEGGE